MYQHKQIRHFVFHHLRKMQEKGRSLGRNDRQKDRRTEGQKDRRTNERNYISN